MISILKCLVFLVSVFQFTDAYCVYNRLKNSTSLPAFIEIGENGALGHFTNGFQTTLVGYESFACCPYTEKTCNPFGSLVEKIALNFAVSFDGSSIAAKYTAYCGAGSGLAFYGSTNDDLYADCVSRNGTVKRVNFDHPFG